MYLRLLSLVCIYMSSCGAGVVTRNIKSNQIDAWDADLQMESETDSPSDEKDRGESDLTDFDHNIHSTNVIDNLGSGNLIATNISERLDLVDASSSGVSDGGKLSLSSTISPDVENVSSPLKLNVSEKNIRSNGTQLLQKTTTKEDPISSKSTFLTFNETNAPIEEFTSKINVSVVQTLVDVSNSSFADFLFNMSSVSLSKLVFGNGTNSTVATESANEINQTLVPHHDTLNANITDITEGFGGSFNASTTDETLSGAATKPGFDLSLGDKLSDSLIGKLGNKSEVSNTKISDHDLTEVEHLHLHNESKSVEEVKPVNTSEVGDPVEAITTSPHGKVVNGTIDLVNMAGDKELSLNQTDNNPDFASAANVDEDITKNGSSDTFEFISSEVTKNAAMAMEFFNFSDSSLTDHLIGEGELHDILNFVLPSHELSTNLTRNIQPELEVVNNSEHDQSVEFQSSQPNVTEVHSVTNSPEGTDITTLEEGLLNNTMSLVSINATEDVTSSVVNASDPAVPECPPPGLCVFWFLAQDACADHKHCIGNRICCRIRCSKTCIEV